jgi:Cys-rich protein (TIGR01571 family)
MSTNPNSAPYASPPEGQWTTGLCGCFRDPCNCWVTLWCPCITFGRIAEILDEGKTTCFSPAKNYVLLLCILGSCVYACTYRAKLRGLFSLPVGGGDCCVHCFCCYCALCQEYSELKNRGRDPSMGWATISHKLEGGTTAPPIPEPGMTR